MKVVNLVEYISVDDSVLLSVDKFQVDLILRALLLFQDNDNIFTPSQNISLSFIARGLSDFLQNSK